MRSTAFLLFPDDSAVNVDDISFVRSLREDMDADPRTGQWRSAIPKDAMTLIQLRRGRYFYTAQTFAEVMESLQLVAEGRQS